MTHSAALAPRTAPPDIMLYVQKLRLTDGSYVFNVYLGQMRFAALDQERAEELALDIVDSINRHSVDTADVIYEY